MPKRRNPVSCTKIHPPGASNGMLIGMGAPRSPPRPWTSARKIGFAKCSGLEAKSSRLLPN